MRYLLILILTLTLTGEVMGGPKKKKKLEKKWKPDVFDTTPVYTEPPKKSFWDAIKESYDPSPFRKIKIKIK